jgi:dTDP-4-amino-4,6-dideoxygalactose transaminase
MHKNHHIAVSPTNIDQDILNHLQERLLNNINNSKSSYEHFQNSLSEITGSKEVLAVNSGTSALHLALLALDIKDGDHVACSTFTFVASVNAISYVNAKPVFIDSEAETWNMCPDLLEQAIKDGKKKERPIRCVIVVHAYGFPAKIEEILTICNMYNIPVIEDAASALGSKYNNRHLGSFGTLGIISFNYNKIITTTGGGAILSQNRKLIEKATYFANQAKTKGKVVEHVEIGYNYKMSGICAELGNVQLPYLSQYVQTKRRIFDTYRSALNNIDGIKFLEEQANIFSNRWITTILFKEKSLQKLIKAKFEENFIEARELWKPMHSQPVFSTCLTFKNGNADNFYNSGLCLPSGLNLKKEDQEKIIELICSFV